MISREARSLSLGAYYRLRPSLNDYHAALNEAGPILVSAATHSGWDHSNVAANDGRILQIFDDKGGHAFVLVGYDEQGFLVLNSWGPKWGGFDKCQGVAHWSYQDWGDSIFDGWVLRLGVSAPGAFDLTVGDQGLFFMQNTQRKTATPAYETVGHMAHLDDGYPVAAGPYTYTQKASRKRSDTLLAKVPTTSQLRNAGMPPKNQMTADIAASY
ncbi:hypothetical protein NKI04_26370 [Mesorhizobium sp. M0814]|uniref:hypothetical protein n=1 Tax=Mesorhizobium sp. M0814 TaxID=2957004 RepID=UPI003339F32A